MKMQAPVGAGLAPARLGEGQALSLEFMNILLCNTH